MTSNIIRDGQTRKAYIEPRERMHEGLAFSYRPMLPEQVEAIDASAQGKKPAEGVRIIAAALTEHLVEWSESDGNRQAPINFENVRRLHFAVFNKLYRMVAGMIPSDPLPDADEEEQDEYVQSLLSKAEGKTPLQTVTESEKNSATA